MRWFDEEDREEDESLLAEKRLKEGRISLGIWLEHSRWPVWWVSLMAFSYLVYWFYGRGFEINLNILNLFLFIFALLLHDNPARFLSSMERSIRPIYGIIVQFPFYAAIQGMLISSGLATILSQWLLGKSSLPNYPFLLYLNAIMMNFFLPTSEGIWEAQGLLVIKSAQSLGVNLPQAINIFTTGELLANSHPSILDHPHLGHLWSKYQGDNGLLPFGFYYPLRSLDYLLYFFSNINKIMFKRERSIIYFLKVIKWQQ